MDGNTTYTPIKINWFEVPGKDEKWKREMISDLGPTRFAQEYGCCEGNTPLIIQNQSGKEYKCKIKDLFKKLNINK